jgi:hypothetical protein
MERGCPEPGPRRSDDDDLLIEGEPTFLDHLALIDVSQGNKGVWNKTGTLDLQGVLSF